MRSNVCTPSAAGEIRPAGDDESGPDSGDNSCKASEDAGGGADCGAAGSSEMPDWDVSLVTSMEDILFGRTEFNQDLSRWNTGSVTDMSHMFEDASSFDQDLSCWDTISVTDMR